MVRFLQEGLEALYVRLSACFGLQSQTQWVQRIPGERNISVH
jgi:hypothetical protein